MSATEVNRAAAALSRRRVARSALRGIERLIEGEREDERRGVRFAAIATGLLFGLASWALLVAATALLMTTALPQPPGVADIAYVAGCALLAFVPLSVAWYFAGRRVRGPRVYLVLGVLAAIGAVVVHAALYTFVTPIEGCPAARAAVDAQLYERAVDELTWCLRFPTLIERERTEALRTRARVLGRLQQHARAVADFDAARTLLPPPVERDWIDYAVYLANLRRYGDSLNALSNIQLTESNRFFLHAQRGWLLHRLGRNAEALASLTAVIAQRPGRYWKVYFSRALAFEGLGDPRRARADLESCAQVLRRRPLDLQRIDADSLQELRAKLAQYGLADKYPL